MNHRLNNSPFALVVLVASLVLTGEAGAFDLNGAWAGDTDNCAKVFIRKGGQITFTDMSDVYGGGFIIDGNQITGKFAKCQIKARKDNGQDINLVAACATDIMLQHVQFNLRQIDADAVSRQFPGMEGMQIKYSRCPVQ
jgi:hypothetical protein